MESAATSYMIIEIITSRLHHHMLLVSYVFQEILVLCRLLLYNLMMYANNLSTLWPSGCICLFAHYSTWLSSLCRRNWKYWTPKMLVRYILSRVCLRSSQFFQISIMQYMGILVFSFRISLMMVVIICVLYLVVIIKSEVWPTCHCLRLGHETMVCAVCL